MNIEEITSDHINQWMQRQLAKAHERDNYANIDVGISQFKGNPATATFAVWHSADLQSRGRNSIEECFEDLAAITPLVIVETKRAAAQKLMDEAAEIEKSLTN